MILSNALLQDETTFVPPTTLVVTGLRRRRSNNDIVDEESVPESVTVPPIAVNESNDSLPVHDGQLDMNSNYTGFVEVIGECFFTVCLFQYIDIPFPCI